MSMLKLRINTDSRPCIMSSFILMCNKSPSDAIVSAASVTSQINE